MNDAHDVVTPMLEDDRKRWEDNLSPLLDDKDKKRYQAAVGSVLYVMHATRPDLAYTIIRLSQFASCPRAIHWDAIKRVLKYIKGTRHYGIALGNTTLENANRTLLTAYFDAAHADTSSRHSTCGYVFLLHGSPIS